MIVACTCKHDQQDKMYGAGNRAANPVNKTKQQGKLVHARCTVCKRIHTTWKNS